MSTHNIGFYEDLTKISLNYDQISSNTHHISSAICQKYLNGRFTFRIEHRNIFYHNYLFSYRLLKKAQPYTLNMFSSGLKRNILTELGRYAVISKRIFLQRRIEHP